MITTLSILLLKLVSCGKGSAVAHSPPLLSPVIHIVLAHSSFSLISSTTHSLPLLIDLSHLSAFDLLFDKCLTTLVILSSRRFTLTSCCLRSSSRIIPPSAPRYTNLHPSPSSLDLLLFHHVSWTHKTLIFLLVIRFASSLFLPGLITITFSSYK